MDIGDVVIDVVKEHHKELMSKEVDGSCGLVTFGVTRYQ